jgi:hypothetical protein
MMAVAVIALAAMPQAAGAQILGSDAAACAGGGGHAEPGDQHDMDQQGQRRGERDEFAQFLILPDQQIALAAMPQAAGAQILGSDAAACAGGGGPAILARIPMPSRRTRRSTRHGPAGSAPR